MTIVFTLDDAVSEKFSADELALFMPLVFDKYTNQFMWQLRHFEKEIKEEDGIIHMHSGFEGPQIKVEGFSIALMQEIEKTLENLNLDAEANAEQFS